MSNFWGAVQDTCRFWFVIELNYLPSANTRSCSTAACPKMFK